MKTDRELAKDECANFMNGKCLGDHPCYVLQGKECKYFDRVVKGVPSEKG